MSYEEDLSAIGRRADGERAEVDRLTGLLDKASAKNEALTRALNSALAEVSDLREQLGGNTPPEMPTAVTIADATRRIDGIDAPRGDNQLILYRSTPATNRWGVEVAVSDGRVIGWSNRVAADAGRMLVPDGGYVLSGHGLGAGYAGQWLLDNATIGAGVTLSTQPEPSTPTPGRLPSRVVALWHHCWEGPLPWLGYPDDVRSQINLLILGIAQSAARGTGRLGYHDRWGGTKIRDAVMAAKQAGVPVLIGIGGSSDGGITITNPAQVTEAADSLSGFVDRYGITGVDIDLEPSGSSWTEPALVQLVDLLRKRHPGFLVGITPGLYGAHTARWLSLARTLGDRYDYMAPMLYDFPEAGDSRLSAVALDKCRQMVAGGVPESKIILGFMTRGKGVVYPNASPTPQVTINAWHACLQRYPGLRGVFHWEDAIDASNGWAWSRAASPVVRDGRASSL